jgi:hypothetical protein
MAITRRDLEDVMSGTDLLAKLVTGRGVGHLVDDLKNIKKSITVRLEPEMFAKIEEYRKKAKTTKTAVLEILIAAGIEATEKQIELDGQMGLEPIFQEPAKPVKKAVKK